MKNKIQKLYAEILSIESEVTVKDGDKIIEISLSISNNGWYITVYEDDGEGYVECDGGICTGSTLDAVQFFLARQ